MREDVILHSLMHQRVVKDGIAPFSMNIAQTSDDDKENPIGNIGVWSVRCSLNMCPICLGTYRKGDEVCRTPNDECLHAFHLSCIKKWLMTNDSCPMCHADYLKCSNNNKSACSDCPVGDIENTVVPAIDSQCHSTASSFHSDNDSGSNGSLSCVSPGSDHERNSSS